MTRHAGLLAVLALACGTTHNAVPGPDAPLTAVEPESAGAVRQPTPVGTLTAAAGVGTDRGYAAIVPALSTGASAAPLPLRQLLAALGVREAHPEQGYLHHGERAVLTWWLADLSVPGTPETVREQLVLTLTARGFDRSVQGDGLQFETQSARVRQLVRVQGPTPRDGGEQETCRLDLVWEVQTETHTPPPTLGAVLEAMPALVDPRVDAAIRDALASQGVVGVTIGVPGSAHEGWSAAMWTEEPEELALDLHGLLRRQGFRADGETYTRVAPPARVSVSQTDDTVRLVFAPLSP